MRTGQVLVAVCALTLGVAASGCKTSEPGVRNKAGWVTGYVPGDVQTVTEAARMAADGLQLRKIEVKSTALDGNVSAYTARDQKVNISITRDEKRPNESYVRVRVGVVGDEDISDQIIRRMREHASGAGGSGAGGTSGAGM